MLGSKSKNRREDVAVDANADPCESADDAVAVTPTADLPSADEGYGAESGTENAISVSVKQKDGAKRRAETDFTRLAEILCKDEETLIEECKLFQIKNIMSRLSKAIVRYGASGGEMKTLVADADRSGLGEIAVSPAYLDGLAKVLGTSQEVKVCAVVDFPFGESSFKVKFSEIKNSVKQGVDGVLTVFNTAALNRENAKVLKKELKKIGKIKTAETGIAVNAEDALSDDIKQAIKLAERSGINYVAFLFGGVTETELTAKIKAIKDYKSKIPVKIMANVENVNAVKTLIRLDVQGIITPFADDIAKELFKEFKIKTVKLG